MVGVCAQVSIGGAGWVDCSILRVGPGKAATEKIADSLTVSDRKEKEISRIFANWSSMRKRKAGRPQVRILTGAEIVRARIVDFYRLYSVDFHFFIAGVLPGADFQRDCKAQWLNLGDTVLGSRNSIGPGLKGILKSVPPDRRFEVELKFARDFESRNVRTR
jgi:hypothetical protein